MASLIRILNPSSTEQAHQSEEALPNEAEQPEEPARPSGSASPTAPMSPGGPTLMGNANSLPDRSGHGASTREPQLNTTDANQRVHYNGRKWEYESYEWLEAGILSLNLKPVGSNSANELVREAYLQSDNPDQLLRLWKATPDLSMCPTRVFTRYLRFSGIGRSRMGKVQWTGFSKKDTTWEAEAYVKQVASGVLNEYWSKKRAKRTAKISKRVRPQRQAR
ncbi:hypothetical protein CRV24_008542 [Beauveria bassiana]|nr:hypothetical protein CRV24_008542 [Beauveria bassiana]